MSLVVIPNTFVDNTVIASAKVNANFAVLAAYINTGAGGDSITGNGRITLPGGLQICWGSQNMPVDGEPETVSFGTAFSTACLTVVTSVDNPYASNPWALGSGSSSPSATGFTGVIYGGPPFETALLRYIAIGY